MDFSNIDLRTILVSVAVLAFSIGVHESSHALAAKLLGDSTAHDEGRISLNPLKHIDPLTTIIFPLILIMGGHAPFAAAKPVPINTTGLKFKEWGMAIVSLAGPLSNLVLALIFSLLFKTLGVVSSEFLGQVVVYGVYINVGLGLFNLIPFPPLDGSRLLWAIAPDGLRDVMDRIESFGFAAIIFFMFVLFPFIQEPLNAANTFVLNLFF